MFRLLLSGYNKLRKEPKIKYVVLGSISSKFFQQLLHAQIPNAQKRQSSQQCIFALLEPALVKTAHKM